MSSVIGLKYSRATYINPDENKYVALCQSATKHLQNELIPAEF